MFLILWLLEKCPNTELFLFRIFLYSDWIQENTDQKSLRIWTLFTQWMSENVCFNSIRRCGSKTFVTISKYSGTQLKSVSFYLKFPQILSILPSFLTFFGPKPKMFEKDPDIPVDINLKLIQIWSTKIDSMCLCWTFC